MIAGKPEPRYKFIPDAHERKRIRTAVSCVDSDGIPKVEGAGTTAVRNGVGVQIMHNGVVVKEGGYGGAWMTEVIRSLRGHHEPQEELVFDTLVRRIAGDTTNPTMIEFGSNWTYYGLWFATALQGSRVVALEPDPHFMEIGRLNADLNSCAERVAFVHGAIGAEPGRTLEFEAESDGLAYTVPQYDLESLMKLAELAHVDLVLADVQGAETILLERALAALTSGKVRFLVLSTHHHSISGDALTHQKALDSLLKAGAHVIAEHSVPESFSGDGLIAVSFDERDADLSVPISFARSRDSLFGEMEFDLAGAQAQLRIALNERESIVNSLFWRWATPVRRTLTRLRRVRARA